MTTLRGFWQTITGQNHQDTPAGAPSTHATPARTQVNSLDLEMAPNDPLLLYLQSAPGVVAVERLTLDSPALAALRKAGVKLIVPLVSQGELIGLINLGPRLSEQAYSSDDRKLLNDLATQAAPAVRVAQMVQQQQAEARERERMEQELRVARIIQQTLLPKDVPHLPGYQVATYYRPAREVGGDFYDFIHFDDGRLGLIIGDVTDKGVPAALVMATTRTLLRASGERLVMPGAVLERVNDLLHPDIPPRMFVTCLYALLDPATGRVRYANAGHDLPYRRHAAGADELRATGMPLGLMPGMTYEEKEIILAPGETVLFHSDGLVEAHAADGEMFGFPRLRKYVADHPGGPSLIEHLLEELAAFTGPEWEQEDDVTLVTLQCTAASVPNTNPTQSLQTITQFTLPSERGNERQAVEKVVAAVEEVAFPAGKLEKLKTAVAEATMNAMEHGNRYQPDLPVQIEVLAGDAAVTVRITDHGGGQPLPDAETPDLEAKLAGTQSPRGWGLFLIENMVDELNASSDDVHHTVELMMYLEDGDDENG